MISFQYIDDLAGVEALVLLSNLGSGSWFYTEPDRQGDVWIKLANGTITTPQTGFVDESPPPGLSTYPAHVDVVASRSRP